MTTKQWIGIEEAAAKYQVSPSVLSLGVKDKRLFIRKSVIIR